MAICPRCGKAYNEPPALSRYYDVDICSNCGVDEAMRDYFHIAPINPSKWFKNPKDE